MSYLLQSFQHSSTTSSRHSQGRLPHACLILTAIATLYLAYHGLSKPSNASQIRIINERQIAAWHLDTAYMTAAAANVTRFKRTWLSKMVPKMQVTGSLPNYGLTPADWQLFKPVIICPKQRPLKHYGGDGDGSKYLCDVGSKARPALRSNCVIYSMGSRGDYKFEQDMLKHTSCQIHTFDCTYNGTSQGPRHTYHRWCVAAAATVAAKGPPYRTWSNITKSLQHDRVDILKMDIDGYEYEVLGEFGSEMSAAGVVLPDEIGIEVHVMIKPKPDARPWLKNWLKILPPDVPHTVPALGLFFLHMANLGYGVYHMDVNTGAPECCSEFSMLRVTG